MRKKVFYKKAEVATLLTLGLVVVGAVMTIVASVFTNNQKNLASKPRADSSESKTRYGSANCTCYQICGGHGQYISNSQSVSGGVRICKCKADAPSSLCPINYQSLPNTPTDPPSGSLGKCDSNYGTYSDLSMCEIVCGVGSCKRCLLGSTSKWQCNVTTPNQISACKKTRTYSTKVNCMYECSNNCTACSFQGAIRWECGGGGPQELNPTPTPQPSPETPPREGCQNFDSSYKCSEKCPGTCLDSDGKSGGKWCCPSPKETPPEGCTNPIYNLGIPTCSRGGGVLTDDKKWCCPRAEVDLCKKNEGEGAYCELSRDCNYSSNNQEANNYCKLSRASNYVCCKPSNASAGGGNGSGSGAAASCIPVECPQGKTGRYYKKEQTNYYGNFYYYENIEDCNNTRNFSPYELDMINDPEICKPAATPTLKASSQCTPRECASPHKGIFYSYKCEGVVQNNECSKEDIKFYSGNSCAYLRNEKSVEEMEANYCNAKYVSIYAKRTVNVSYHFSKQGAVSINPNQPTVHFWLYNGISGGLSPNPKIPDTHINNFPLTGNTTVITGSNVVCFGLEFFDSENHRKTLSGCSNVVDGNVNLIGSVSNAK